MKNIRLSLVRSFGIGVCYFTFVTFFSIVIGQNTMEIVESKFDHVKNSDGLMHNSTLSTFQDSRGYLWHGTSNGLYKFDGYNYKLYNNELGNKNSVIGNKLNSIAEDGNGVVWIGTEQGLCYYDRNSDCFVRTIPSIDSPSDFVINKAVKAIYVDDLNNLWVGTSQGLYNFGYSVDGYKMNMYPSYEKDGLSSDVVNGIVSYKKGLLISTNNGVKVVDISEDGKISIKKIHHKALNGYISSLLVDKDDTIWVGKVRGLHKVKEDENGVLHVEPFYLSGFVKSSVAKHVRSLYDDGRQTLWIGTGKSGIIEFNKITGVVRVHQKNDKNVHSLKSNEINDIYKDRFDVLWISTSRGGISKLDLHKKKIDHFNHNPANGSSLSGNMINAIFEDSKGNIWVSTFENGLNVMPADSKEPVFIKFDELSLGSNNIQSICEDNYGRIWIGTLFDGIFQVVFEKGKIIRKAHFTKKNTRGKLVNGKFAMMYKDRKGDIWIGGDSKFGLFRLTPNAKFGEVPELIQYKKLPKNSNSLSSNFIVSIFEDSNNILWVGCNTQGLVKVLRDSNNNPIQYTRIKGGEHNPRGLNNNAVFDIFEDNVHNIWLATYGGGLNMIPRDEIKHEQPKIIKYKVEQGLPSNEVYGIEADDMHNMWISTNYGISKFDPLNHKFKNFGINDGLQANNFRKYAHCKGKNGMLYFGGINGLNRFNPDDFEINKIEPITEITGFKLFNRDVAIGEEVFGKVLLHKSISETNEIVLKHEHNSFSFEFSGMHFASPSQNKYKYKLEGFDKKWLKADANWRFANYSNLSPGNYVFKVVSSNNDDVWGKHPRMLKLKVLPPFWKTWWAYFLYFLFLVILMWAFRRFILVSADFRNKIQIEKLEQSKIKEINQIKLEFFTNISHEFKTPLTLILGPLKSLIDRVDIEGSARDSLMIMDRNANHLFRLINQVMDFRKADMQQLEVETSEGDLVDFSRQMLRSFHVLAHEKSLTLHFESEENELVGYFDWDKLEKIFNNLVSNSIKYTPPRGSVSLEISYSKQKVHTSEGNIKMVKIVLRDNGVGIPKNKISKIFNRFYQVQETNTSHMFGSGVGLALTKKLVDLLDGSIEVASDLNKGSEFLIYLPVHKEKVGGLVAKEILEKEIITEKMSPVLSEEKQEMLLPEAKDNTNPVDESAIKQLPMLLIVEDNLDMQKFLKASFESMYQVVQAYDGVQGLKLALEHVPNIIISDVMMEHMDGVELCKEIKNNEITNHIPIILLTARASIDHKLEGLEVGADSYIAKPFDMRILQLKVKNLLEERKFLSEKFSSTGITLDSQKVGINQTEKLFLEKAEKIIEENLMNSEFGVEDLGSCLNFSRMQLYRKLKSIRGLSANEFIRSYRIKKSALLLRDTDMNVTEILYAIGFTNRSYFSKCFKQMYNMSPKEYAKKHNSDSSS